MSYSFSLSALPRVLHSFLHAVGLDERRCAACLSPFSPAPGSLLPLCPVCQSLLVPKRKGFCPRCGEPVMTLYPGRADIAPPPDLPSPSSPGAPAPDNTEPSIPCGACLTVPPPWTEFRFHGLFNGLLRDLLHRAKYGADAAALDLLGRMLAKVCADLPRPDAIVPMPLHPHRLRQRGFNQSREIAKPVAKFFHAPLGDALLLRRLHVRPQTGLSRKERLINLDGVFAASPAVSGLHILLIDDTSTTGTSLRCAAQALLNAGARRVDVAVIAHASLRQG